METIKITKENRVELSEKYSVTFGPNVVEGDFLLIEEEFGVISIIPEHKFSPEIINLIIEAHKAIIG